MHHGEFRDARLVAVYDAEFLWSREDDFFFSVVGETPAARVLDLGCGTGRLAIALAAAGHTVSGVDPARASLMAARAKPGAERVRWIQGTSSALAADTFDVALMTSHVSQFIVGDDEWAATLSDLHRTLVPDGRLVFDSRDPSARGWEQWNPVDSDHRVQLSDGRVVQVWNDVTSVADGAVSFNLHYGFPEGDDLVSSATMRFRSVDEVRAGLHDAGFAVEQIHGGWRREPVGAGDGELIVLARARRPLS